MAATRVPAAKGVDEVFYPGELEANNERRNRRDGIQFPDDTFADLKPHRQGNGAGAPAPISVTGDE